jgi:hypothetical protein
MGIARHRIARAFERGGRERGWRGDSAFEGLPADGQLEEIWMSQRRLAIVRAGLDELRRSSRLHEKTIRAFEMLADGDQCEAVAAALGMTLDDVYQAKNRVASRLRAVVARLEEQYDDE